MSCPFCGCDETPVAVVDDKLNHSEARAYCANCDAAGPLVTTQKGFPTVLHIDEVDELEAAALEAWNRRV